MLRENVERRRAAWERELVARMRRDEPDAYREFLRTFKPLLMDEARRLRVQPALWEEVVDECLDDVALQLRRETTPIRARWPRTSYARSACNASSSTAATAGAATGSERVWTRTTQAELLRAPSRKRRGARARGPGMSAPPPRPRSSASPRCSRRD